jgi:hypothetical protein
MLDALRPVVATLQRLGVKHFVGGSVASSVHGVARTTLDVDIIEWAGRLGVSDLLEQASAEA